MEGEVCSVANVQRLVGGEGFCFCNEKHGGEHIFFSKISIRTAYIQTNPLKKKFWSSLWWTVTTHNLTVSTYLVQLKFSFSFYPKFGPLYVK